MSAWYMVEIIFLFRPEPTGSNQTRLVLGMFTVYPAIGSVSAGGQQTIQVECLAESQGKCEEVNKILSG